MPEITTSDGARLTFEDEGSGRPVVFIGGFGMALGAWALQHRALAPTHRVVLLDQRGHGASEPRPGDLTLARLGRDVGELLDVLALHDVLVIGASMGASTIWSYVDQVGTGRLRGIVSIDQTPKMVNEGDWQLGMYDLTPAGVDEFVTKFPGAHQPFHQIPPAEVLQLLLAGRDDTVYDRLRPLLRDHTTRDWRHVLPRVDVPVLVLTGRHSPLWPYESSLYVADRVQDGRAVVLEESGHVPFLEEPDAVNRALLEFAT